MRLRKIAEKIQIGSYYLLCETQLDDVLNNNPNVKVKKLIKIDNINYNEICLDSDENVYYKKYGYGIVRWGFEDDIIYELGDKDLEEYWPQMIGTNNELDN